MTIDKRLQEAVEHVRNNHDKINDYGTGWNRTERMLINLIRMIQTEEDPEKRKEYQNMINEITKPTEKDQPNDPIIEMIKNFKCEKCGSKSMCCDCWIVELCQVCSNFKVACVCMDEDEVENND